MIKLTKLFLALGVASLVSSTALAYELLDPPRRWFPGDLPRNVIVDNGGLAGVNDGNGGVSAATSAVEAWNNPSVAAPLNILSTTTSNTALDDISLGDGISHMVFGDPFNVCERTCLAATFTGYFDDTQTATCGGLEIVRVFDSDIVFNTDPGFGPFRIGWTSESEADGCSNEVYIETVTTHEVGHLIGLGHEDGVNAIMNSSIASCDNKPIQVDDIDGRDALYNCAFVVGSSCGDGVCDPGEDKCSCAADCGSPLCGDGEVSTCVGEECEPTDTAMCSDVGAFVDDSSDATCDEACTYDTSSCTLCAANETDCTDGIDNDCDGSVDSNDSDCGGGGLPEGAACEFDNECQSGKCRGRPGGMICR